MTERETNTTSADHSMPPANGVEFDGLLTVMDGPPPPIRTQEALCIQCKWAVADVLVLPCIHVSTLINSYLMIIDSCM